MNANRTTQIAEILAKRRPFVAKIVQVEENLRSLATTLEQLQQQRDTLLQKVKDEQVLGQLQALDSTILTRTIQTELFALDKLKNRMNRNTLNIGVVGRARQGKSRFLQSLTGLTTAEIPDGDRQHCTGVRSTIYHSPQAETHGEVYFYSDRDFIENVLAPYYDKLHLSPKPVTLDAFANSDLPELPTELNSAESRAMYAHLQRYHQHLPHYKDLIGSASPRQIAKEEIRQYVAQDTLEGQRIFFNYLAVKEVKIICPFPNSEIGQVALVDMPGLGDTGIGDEERLVKALGRDVDAVIFVRMPKSSGDYWADYDVKLYDTAHSALIDLPIHLWSFLVLNRTHQNSKNGDNWHNCQDLANSRTENHIDVVQHVIANCADTAEAGQVLDQVLNYLRDNITALDKRYATLRQDSLTELQSAIALELAKAKNALSQAEKSDNWFPQFLQLFDRVWQDLTNGLEELLLELREFRDMQDDNFKQHVKAALQNCRDNPGLPTEAEIQLRRNEVGSYDIAYNQYLNEVRAHLSKQFLFLDEGLKQSIEKLKLKVAKILIEQGKLGTLTPVREVTFIHEIATLIPDNLPQLKLGFTILADFEISYRGLIQHRIRQHLDRLTPDDKSYTLSDSPSSPEILSCLTSLQAETVYRCETVLDDLLIEPNQAAFAIVEEFIDRVLRAKGVKSDWQIFLEEMRSQVWSNEFQELSDRTRTRREWLNLVQRATTENQISAFQFLD
ncbi:MAG: hypothetical protein SAJ12_09660 [Jaaginema sp. PMC 1079.18]|nr:hypothetical protein [Jaaginema sp. PMC 1080.18]MEC4851266.1 hypothetical protein [Jaaginema sp. PMC 1079.18]MEC4868033.1 hypothetical protein [Jaaginema sp. PMC 1078.18]